MPKISLSSRPGSFKATVGIPVAGAGVADVEMTFKYRTRTEYAQLIDRVVAEAKARGAVQAGAAETDEPIKFEQIIGKSVESDAAFVQEIAEGWDLPDEFGTASLVKLMDMYGGASKAITDAYAKAINEGRSGN